MSLSARDCRTAVTSTLDSFNHQAYAGRMQTTASTATTRLRALTLDDLLAVRTPWNQHRIALSPDGRYLAFAARLESRSVDSQSVLPSAVRSNVSGAQLWVTDIERGESWPLLGRRGPELAAELESRWRPPRLLRRPPWRRAVMELAASGRLGRSPVRPGALHCWLHG